MRALRRGDPAREGLLDRFRRARRQPPLGLRRRLVLAAVGTVALALAAITGGFHFVLDHRLSTDADNVVHSRVQAGAALVSVEDGRLKIEETPLDSTLAERVWVFQGTRAIDRAAGDRRVQAAAEALARARAPATRDVAAVDQRLRSRAVVAHGRRVGTIVAAVSLVPYENTAHIAVVSSLILDAIVMLAVLLVARALVSRALRPVARMTAQASEWSEHDLDRRFAMGPARDDLTALAATLDALLGRLSASLRHEKRFSAEMAHELRTPLATLRAEAELALEHASGPEELRESLALVQRQSERMTAVIETLMAAAQREADPHSGTVDASAAATAAVEAASGSADARGVELELRRGPAIDPIEINADPALTTQLLLPLLDNAVRHARSRVTLGYGREGEVVVFRVRDDGPGVEPGEAERIFEPGARGSAANGHSGAGLGLALARRLARSAGGDVSAEPSEAGGSFAVRLPAS